MDESPPEARQKPTTPGRAGQWQPPGAPSKPNFRGPDMIHDTPVERAVVEHIRLRLLELGAAQRRDVLQHLPRHTIEPLFLAYAEWKAQRAPHHFQQLMEVVSDLEAQVEAHALGAFGHASLGSWHEQLAAAIAAAGAAASPKDLAEAFLHSLNSSSSSRKALEFA